MVCELKDYRSSPKAYGEVKKKTQFLLTPTASESLNTLVEEYKSTRSDFLEKVIRGLAKMGDAERYELLQQLGVIGEAAEE